ncbi:hypothetical protein EVAR_48774_1 [Eumeta japonica]|uniref:Uncharacterized protein n=1 Tax=Eumeta variegata TaxID=151549 RepID=A0A4C1Y5D1_EUMVA|nr:hypothetical protein EVAR_48774_1 [Eumeta japonica]
MKSRLRPQDSLSARLWRHVKESRYFQRKLRMLCSIVCALSHTWCPMPTATMPYSFSLYILMRALRRKESSAECHHYGGRLDDTARYIMKTALSGQRNARP